MSFSFDDEIQEFVVALPGAVSTTAGQLNFDLANLHPFESRTIDITMQTFAPPVIEGDEIINFIASVSPDATDNTPADNVFELAQIVVNSFDPNDKRVLQGEEIYEEQTDEYLDYIIRFQNTGTANAVTVRIEDELHPNLDWSTLRPVNASHDYRVKVTGGNHVEFIFDDIDLPYESADAEGSNGFIAYKIKPVEDIQIGDVMEGNAAIYFDYNLPIITNIATTEVVEYLRLNDVTAHNFLIHPNPASDVIYLETRNNIAKEKMTIYNLQGRQLMTFSGEPERINIESLSSGVYFLVINTSEGAEKYKLIKN
jgi:hypothetical protein